MRYTLDVRTNTIKPVTCVEVDGRCVFNPSDELLDSNQIGYAYERRAPTGMVLGEFEKLVHAYEIDNNVIRDVWTVVEMTPPERLQIYRMQIDKLNAECERYKNAGSVQYDGKGYIPRWVFEFYNAMINLNQMTEMFPCDIAADDGTSRSFTYEEFMQLYAFISMTFAEYTRQVNAQIAELNAKIALLEDN